MVTSSRFALAGLVMAAVTPVLALPVLAEEPFKPETVIVEETIAPGPNVLVATQEWHGASRINVFSADDFTFKGILSTGSMAQFTLSPDGKTAYAMAVYLKRISYGDMEAVLQVFDVSKASVVKEIALPPVAAMVGPFKNLLIPSADGHFVYVQNATPATSVTVVDVVAGSVAGEVPTPGCWGIYPSLSGGDFSTVCGDGTFLTVDLDDAGKAVGQTKSDPIFDPDTDPLFVHAERIGEALGFLSFKGDLVLVSDTGGKVAPVDRFSLVDGIEGGWAPGGFAVMAYAATPGILFATMHPDAKDGSHKDGAKEIWAVDVAAKRVLYRSVVEGVKSVFAVDAPAPTLFALNDDEGAVYRYSTDPEAKFAAKLVAEKEGVGHSTLLLTTP